METGKYLPSSCQARLHWAHGDGFKGRVAWTVPVIHACTMMLVEPIQSYFGLLADTVPVSPCETSRLTTLLVRMIGGAVLVEGVLVVTLDATGALVASAWAGSAFGTFWAAFNGGGVIGGRFVFV